MKLASRRRLIVNADDFGLSEGVNEGLAEAFERGIVTSASLLVRGRAAAHAARYAREHPALGVGLHLDLGEWAHDGDRWTPVYRVVDLEDPAKVSVELRQQLARFRALTGSAPTHLDSHQHVHREEPVRSALARAARELGVPARDLTPGIRHRGDFYGQGPRGEPVPGALGADRLERIVAELPAGVSELACHPGRDPGLASCYRAEREREVEALTDPRVRARIEAEGIELISFATLRSERRRRTGRRPEGVAAR